MISLDKTARFDDREVPSSSLFNSFLEGLAAFRRFLTHEFSEENLDFWLECEALKLEKISKVHKMAAKIYNRFILPGAENEVRALLCFF